MNELDSRRARYELTPILPRPSLPDWWSESMWIGQIDSADLGSVPIPLADSFGYARARLLLWDKDSPRGFIEVPIEGGCVESDELRTAIASLPRYPARGAVPRPPISVVICTRDRPILLADMLDSLDVLRYPDFEVVVVDNNPASGLTPPVVLARGSSRIRLVEAPTPGLAVARNVGLQHARHEIVAFTDDDVVLDARWLDGIASGFARSERVACVSGMVPTAEIATPAQLYFDRRVAWSSSCAPAVFDLAAPPAESPLFPFRVADFGTGANFAVRRSVVCRLGGFDAGLGVGSPASGGEDIDMFLRILLAGYALAYEPAAVVWHRHRTDFAGLAKQMRDYGVGLGAWITKLALNPRTATMIARRVIPALRRLRSVTVVTDREFFLDEPALARLHRTERRGVVAGPAALLRSRLAGRRARPLRSTMLGMANQEGRHVRS